MRNVSTLLLTLFIMLALPAATPPAQADNRTLPMKEFLARSRRTNQAMTYARLSGSLQHRRRGSALLTIPIYFGIIMHPERTAGQILLNNNEGYLIGLAKSAALTTITPMPQNKTDQLGFVGVRASDLTMSFLFCEPEKELEPETLSGVVPCRVFILDDPENREKIKIWISSEHCFPLQAEFYKAGENKPYRLLEASGFTRKNDLYYVRRVRLEGPGWRTRIEFTGADLNRFTDPAQIPPVIIPLRSK